MNFQKRDLLIVIAITAIVLYYYDTKDVPKEYSDILPTLGGGFYAANFLFNLTK